MNMKLTILGGSTPFTVALLDVLSTEKDMPSHDLMLFGRNQNNLSAVCNYGAFHLKPLGWTVDYTTDLAKALDGSVIVLHQIRYGDLQGRANDEKISIAANLPPDETLGPGAMLSILRQVPHLDRLAEYLGRYCPDAWVLNLTNPLSTVVYRLSQQGVKNCVGLCELPRVTVKQAAAILKEQADTAQWTYCGLNHRGFITSLSWKNGNDRTMELAACLNGVTIGGVTADDIAAMGAIPTKYFRLYQRPNNSTTTKSRALYLENLRKRILSELGQNIKQSPAALQERYMAWYPDAVIPMISALSSSTSSIQEVNQIAEKGIVEEGRVPVSKKGIGTFLQARPNKTTSRWLEKIYDHERAVINALDSPGKATISAALALDLMMPEDQIETSTKRILNELSKGSLSC